MWRPPSSRASLRTGKSSARVLFYSYGTSTRTPPPTPPPPTTFPNTYFLPSTPRSSNSNSNNTKNGPSSSSSTSSSPEEDDRTIRLGRTIRILQERMPTLLHSPLPTEILSPSISLHLFPSTHPHLPVVRGRVAYIAALWTAPIAWRRLPGRNTTLEVVSERMLAGEVLRIRWKGEGEFEGVFEFEFDELGRVKRHVIENCEKDDGGENLAGVITVTEWLLGKARGQTSGGGLAWQYERVKHGKR